MPPESPATAATADRNTVIRRLCAAFFDDPDRIIQPLTHPIDGPWIITPHAHDDQLQFDLLERCTGRAWLEGRWHPLSGTSAMVAMPGQDHGYELGPANANDPPGRVYHLRLRLDASRQAGLRGVFPALVTDLGPAAALTAAMRVVIRLGAVAGIRPPMLMARLSEAMCLWPGTTGTGSVADAPCAEPLTHERGMSAALDMIDRRLTDPPTIEELAGIAHFSPRHFSRRFHAALGCTPHTYITARRFAMARQVLSQDRLKINQVAEHLGFGSVATFSRWFSQQAGISPTEFRANPGLM